MGKPSPDDLLTVAEAADLSGVSETTLREKARDGLIPARKLGRDWVFRRGDVRKLKPRKPGRPAKKGRK